MSARRSPQCRQDAGQCEPVGFQYADHLARRHLRALLRRRPHRLVGRAQGWVARAVQFHRDDSAARDPAREGDAAGGDGPDRGAGRRREVDPAMAPAVGGGRGFPAAYHRRTQPHRPGAADGGHRCVGAVEPWANCRRGPPPGPPPVSPAPPPGPPPGLAVEGGRRGESGVPRRPRRPPSGPRRQGRQQRPPRTHRSVFSHARTVPCATEKSGSWPGSVEYRPVVDSGVTRHLAGPVHFLWRSGSPGRLRTPRHQALKQPVSAPLGP